MKPKTGSLGIGDENLLLLIKELCFHKANFQDPVMKQPGFHSSCSKWCFDVFSSPSPFVPSLFGHKHLLLAASCHFVADLSE